MTKDEIFAQAGVECGLYVMPITLGLAKESLSATDAADRVSVLAKRIKKSFAVAVIASVPLAAIAGCLWFAMLSALRWPAGDHTLQVVGVLLACLLGATSTMPLWEVRTRVLGRWGDAIELLTPITGTDQCVEALKHLEQGGELVSHWRDLAVLERGQLHGFDCDMMRALHMRHERKTRVALYKAKKDEACRKVHGISFPVEAAELVAPAHPA
jgi:hypothetical protein